jgi:cation diffusion facilitator CzcD-associated flavoprotein CzcO
MGYGPFTEWEELLAETTDVVVVGAGPAGLAVAACLGKAGLDFIVLERNLHVASSWRRHYERLHLHTVKQLSSLPYFPYPQDYPRYIPRNLVIEYLDRYAAHFDLRPRFGENVRSVRRSENGWIVEGTSSLIQAAHVVIASGFNSEPVSPVVPGAEKFTGRLIHSADYFNAEPFAGQSVLVVGMGNTGAEVALDLCEGGAQPTISLRNGVHIVPRDLFGIPIQVVATLASKALPMRANDALFPLILDLALGNPAKYGIRRPQQGILQQIAELSKIPVLDVGTVRKIAEGAIKIAPGLSAITEDGAVFAGGSEAKFDAIIFATGYRPNYRDFLASDDIKASDGGTPNKGTRNSTLHFVGFRNPVSGLLREISREAVQIADRIVRQRQDPAVRRA